MQRPPVNLSREVTGTSRGSPWGPAPSLSPACLVWWESIGSAPHLHELDGHCSPGSSAHSDGAPEQGDSCYHPLGRPAMQAAPGGGRVWFHLVHCEPQPCLLSKAEGLPLCARSPRRGTLFRGTFSCSGVRLAPCTSETPGGSHTVPSGGMCKGPEAAEGCSDLGAEEALLTGAERGRGARQTTEGHWVRLSTRCPRGASAVERQHGRRARAVCRGGEIDRLSRGLPGAEGVVGGRASPSFWAVHFVLLTQLGQERVAEVLGAS